MAGSNNANLDCKVVAVEKDMRWGNIVSYSNIKEAIIGKDIVCTDSLPASVLDDFKDCQVTTEIMELANEGAILNPCPPFYRGEEVSDDVIESEYFVGYEFKKVLLEVHQAIMIHLLRIEIFIDIFLYIGTHFILACPMQIMLSV